MMIYAVGVLLTGYRRSERWAWWVTWGIRRLLRAGVFLRSGCWPVLPGGGGSDDSRPTAHMGSVSSALSGHRYGLIGVRFAPASPPKTEVELDVSPESLGRGFIALFWIDRRC